MKCFPESDTLPEIMYCLEELTNQYEGLTIVLTGSYSTQSATKGSDIDILIFVRSQTTEEIVHDFRKIINLKNSLLMKKLDCKVLSKGSVSKLTNIDYLFLSSSLHEGTILFGSPIKLKLDPTKLRDALIFLEEQLQDVYKDIALERNYEINAYLLFSITKSLYHLERIISQNRRKKPFKNILPKKLFHRLARTYENLTTKGVQSGLNMRLTKRGQKSGNYETLSEGWGYVQSFLQVVKYHFFTWFDTET